MCLSNCTCAPGYEEPYISNAANFNCTPGNSIS